MKVEKLAKDNKGITIITLVTTIMLLVIIAALVIRVSLNSKIIDRTKEVTNKIDEQEEQQQSLSNMVRNLYK